MFRSTERFSLRRLFVAAMLLGAVFAWLAYRMNRSFGSFLADEGYLWYGIQRVLAGEIPIRDFMSYEIGRYYLAAAMLGPFHAQGLLAMRAALGMVAALTLGLCIWLAGKHARDSRLWWLAPCALLFEAWLAPRHKIFDIGISVLLLFAVYRLFEHARSGRFFQLGVAVGAAAVIGQNHGLYGLLASMLAFALLAYGRRQAPEIGQLAAWVAGVALGYLPVILMALFVHGFAQAEYEALRYILVEYKGTNLPLPIPWPWSAAYGEGGDAAHIALAWFLLAMPVGLAVALTVILRRWRGGLQPGDALFAAAWTVAVPYANVAFSRADTSHLAQAMLPYLMLAVAAPGLWGRSRGWQPLVSAALLLVSLPLVIPLQPRAALLHPKGLEAVIVGEDHVMLDRRSAEILALAEDQHVQGSVLAVPFYPGVAAALHERSPTWEIYPLFPRSPAFEQRELARLDAAPPAAILVSTAALDGRDELAYPRTHPLLYRHIETRYREVAVTVAGKFELYERTYVPHEAEGSPVPDRHP